MNAKLMAKKSGINGKGCFASVPFQVRRKIGELVGERFSNREAARRVARGGKVRICELDEKWSIDASRGGEAITQTHRRAPRESRALGGLAPWRVTRSP